MTEGRQRIIEIQRLVQTQSAEVNDYVRGLAEWTQEMKAEESKDHLRKKREERPKKVPNFDFFIHLINIFWCEE